jgi:hypothetical protein
VQVVWRGVACADQGRAFEIAHLVKCCQICARLQQERHHLSLTSMAKFFDISSSVVEGCPIILHAYEVGWLMAVRATSHHGQCIVTLAVHGMPYERVIIALQLSLWIN